MGPEMDVQNAPAEGLDTSSVERADDVEDGPLQSNVMQHIQHLTLSWLRKPSARVAEPAAPPLELPDREPVGC